MSTAIPDEAVEAAAKARGCVWTPAKAKHPACRECREQARKILEAAALYLMAEAWDEGAEAMVDEGLSEYEYSRNPYRKDML